MRTYLNLLQKIMDKGVTVQTGSYLPNENRQPTAKRLHAEQISFNLRKEGFPAVTTKPLWWRGVVAELLWFLRGEGTMDFLRQHKVNQIWESWVKKDAQGNDTGDLGPVYGRQMRHYQGVEWVDRPEVQPDLTAEEIESSEHRLVSSSKDSFFLYDVGGYLYGIQKDGADGSCIQVHKLGRHERVREVDQIAQARDDIRAVIANPYDRARRRIIVSLWNPTQIGAMALPPCHTFHAYDLVPPDRNEDRWQLSLHLFARSIDAYTGLPFNIASYALMLEIMAAVTGCDANRLTITFNDVHIYDNQFKAVEEQLNRDPYPSPDLIFETGHYSFTTICPDLSIEQVRKLTPDIFRLASYRHHPAIERPEVAV